MNILFLGFILFMGLVPVVENFKAKMPIYTFRRNYISSRPLQIVLFAWLLFFLLILLIVEYNASYSMMNDIVMTFATIVVFALFSGYDYLKKGEGHYEEGLILRGLFYPWNLIEGCDFYDYNLGKNILVVRFKSKQTIRFILPSQIARDLKSSLDRT